MSKEALGRPLQPQEYPSKDEASEYNKLAGPIRKSRTVKMIGSILAASTLGSLLSACRPAPQECDQPYPKLCIDTKDWKKPYSDSVSITWNAPEGTVKNNIYKRSSLDEQRQIITGIGPRRIIVFANPQVPDVEVIDVTFEGGMALAVNPYKDHYLSVRACKTPEECVTSEEVKIPKQP